MKQESSYKLNEEFISLLDKEIKKESFFFSSSQSASGHKIRFRISDDLMSPSLLPDDRVSVEPASVNEVKVGNLVLIKVGQKPMVRRVIRFIVEESDIYLVTKADASAKEEDPIKDISIIGRVIKLERDGEEIKVPDTSGIIDALASFRTLSPGRLFKEVLSRIMPFTSRNQQNRYH